jgi:hypothetical protein
VLGQDQFGTLVIRHDYRRRVVAWQSLQQPGWLLVHPEARLVVVEMTREMRVNMVDVGTMLATMGREEWEDVLLVLQWGWLCCKREWRHKKMKDWSVSVWVLVDVG